MMTVTKQQCDDRHSKGKTLMTVMVALTVVFLMLATFAIQQASSANDRASRAEQEFRSHAAAQVVELEYIKASLERIEKSLDDLGG